MTYVNPVKSRFKKSGSADNGGVPYCLSGCHRARLVPPERTRHRRNLVESAEVAAFTEHPERHRQC